MPMVSYWGYVLVTLLQARYTELLNIFLLDQHAVAYTLDLVSGTNPLVGGAFCLRSMDPYPTPTATALAIGATVRVSSFCIAAHRPLSVESH